MSLVHCVLEVEEKVQEEGRRRMSQTIEDD